MSAKVKREQARRESERLEQIELKARLALKDVRGVRVNQQAYIGFDPTISMSPTMVMVHVDAQALAGPRPRALVAKTATKEEKDAVRAKYKEAYRAWLNDALAKGEVAIDDAKKVLSKAGIKWRAGSEYQWPILRLA